MAATRLGLCQSVGDCNDNRWIVAQASVSSFDLYLLTLRTRIVNGNSPRDDGVALGEDGCARDRRKRQTAFRLNGTKRAAKGDDLTHQPWVVPCEPSGINPTQTPTNQADRFLIPLVELFQSRLHAPSRGHIWSPVHAKIPPVSLVLEPTKNCTQRDGGVVR